MLAIVSIIAVFVVSSTVSDYIPESEPTVIVSEDVQYWEDDDQLGWVYLAPDIDVNLNTTTARI